MPKKFKLFSGHLIVAAISTLAVFAALLALGPAKALAANPTTINFQGKVTNADGTNVSNGTYSFIFRIYNTASPTTTTSCTTTASCLWEETQSSVSVTNGVFQVELGSVCALTSASCNNSTGGPINFSTSNALYLTMKFNGDAAGFMTPTIHITSVPFALQADNSSSLGGLAAANFVQLAQGVQTETSTSNPSIFVNKNNASGTPNILELQKAGSDVLVVNNSGTLLLGKAGTGGLNGQLVFNTTNASNTTITLVAASTGTSYSLTLPTTGPSTSQCLQTDSATASQLKFGSCGTGGGGSLASDYNSSGTSGNTITYTTAGAGIIIQDASTPLSGNLLTLQNNSGSFNYLTFNLASSVPHLEIYGASSTAYADIFYDAGSSTANFQASTGTTAVGNGTGSISILAGTGAGITITGHANSTWQTDSGGSLTIQGGSTLSLLSTTGSAISLDSGSTGAVNVGTGSNAKAVVLGNSQSSTTVTQTAGAASTTLSNTGLVVAGGDETINAQADLRFADADSSNWVAFQAPTTVSTNVTWTLPSADSAGCLQSNGSGTLSFSACGDTDTQSFTSTGTWTKPNNALMVIIEVWGGGGGGGGGAGGSTATIELGGGAGGGGAYAVTQISASSLGSTVPVTVGSGGNHGNGGSSAAGTAGSGGGPSCFSTTTNCAGSMYLEAFGGGGGSGGGTTTSFGGGGGGGGTDSAGGNSTTNTAGTGGGPGGSAVSTDNTGFGGAGGRTATTGTPGVAGTGAWGGGGGGGSSTNGAGNGGNGGGSQQGGAGGGAGASCAVTTCTQRSGGAGGHVPGTGGGGGTAGSGAGGAGGTGSDGVGSGGDGGGGGAVSPSGTGGVGGNGGARGGGGGGGGAGETTTGGNGGSGGGGYARIRTLMGTGADLAEIYCTNDSSIAPGDAVAIDGSLKAGVQKTNGDYDPGSVGIISTNPGLTTGNIVEQCAKPVLVALAGRVPLKVSLENGIIKPGDLLTASATPGVAMKATKAGVVIGQALTAYDGSQPSGYVVAFIKNAFYNGESVMQLLSGVNTNQGETLGQQTLDYFMTHKQELQSQPSLSEVTTDRVSAGLEVVTPSVLADNITSNTITTGKAGTLNIKDNAGNSILSFDDQGNASLPKDLNVGGGLTVAGDAKFTGNAFFYKLVTFTEKTVFNNDLTLNAHLISGGSAPQIKLEAGAGETTAPPDFPDATLAKSDITGNDVSGSFNVTAGDNNDTGDMVTVKFDKAYAQAPHVFLSAINDKAANLHYYIKSDQDGFTIVVPTDLPDAGTTFSFNYFVVQ